MKFMMGLIFIILGIILEIVLGCTVLSFIEDHIYNRLLYWIASATGVVLSTVIGMIIIFVGVVFFLT